MPVKSLQMQVLTIPFKVSFKHASAERQLTQTVIVTAVSKSGMVGYGESCPREYVTQEDISSCLEFFRTHHAMFMQLGSIGLLREWVLEHESLIDKNPAAWCAVELALLDMLAAEQQLSVEELLGLPALTGIYSYSAIVGEASLEKTESQVRQFAKMGFKDFKVKISGKAAEDNARLEIIQGAVPNGLSIRLDGNNLWKEAEEVIAYLADLQVPVIAIEEPLAAFDYSGMKKIAEKIPVKIILDESFLNARHFDFCKNANEIFIINLRISKMGGILRSLEISRIAAKMGLPLIIGAQVGETSILTRAALTVAGNAKGLLFQEGAFGTLLLAYDIVERPLVFGMMGKLDPSELLDTSLPGFQMAYDAGNIGHSLAGI
jgi:L-alanine-DL-glutamate epimerase-like enolase superfamily enzyme